MSRCVVRAALLSLALVASMAGTVPLAAQDASPIASPRPGGVRTEVLATGILPARAIPSGAAIFALYRDTYAPGGFASQPSLAPWHAAGLEVVVRGRYALVDAGPIEVARAGTPFETVSPGTEVTLGPGDADVDAAIESATTVRNAGPGPLEVIGVDVFSATASPPTPGAATPAESGITFETLAQLEPSDWEQAKAALGAGPVVLRLARVTLAPGAAVTLGNEAGPGLRYVEAGVLTWEAAGPGTQALNVPIRITAQHPVPWTPLAPAARLVLRNTGAVPVVYLETTLAPAGAATPQP